MFVLSGNAFGDDVQKACTALYSENSELLQADWSPEAVATSVQASEYVTSKQLLNTTCSDELPNL